ncbi:winged helix-turn-helix domain-containing protein [Aliikangiella sp. G2MR2-5]|uniref:winged helix-turn-helix domain-containing protein n=1 Tax=Aliikangiella sp. G2MR2-5 TaxID=2788943 RepID=UPI0018AB353E|nr:winged helix-turn-helix domain-containing protein [Aliikangiella sp. G2MR2-5]
MKRHFRVGQFEVDLNRNQIRNGSTLESLQPRILAVLALLADMQGEVVSHDEIMERIWGESTVSPNTLQRCIAQLRKVLGDDSRRQEVIKTHSKKGYSLELPVEWRPDNASHSGNNKKILNHWSSSFAVVLLALAGSVFWFYYSSPSLSLRYNHITPITASDEKEFNPNYSPDGRYLVYHRYLDVCENHIWAKDLKTQKEYRLTKDAGVYGAHSWSYDGTQIAFIKQENCQSNTQIEHSQCWRLQTLDFAAALQSPVTATQRLDCDESPTTNPVWLNNGDILMLKQDRNRQKLMRFDARSNQLTEFYRSPNMVLYDFDYSRISEKIAVIGSDSSNTHYIELLNTSGKLESIRRIKPIDNLSKNQRYYSSFDSRGRSLVTNLQTGLFHLSLDGNLFPIEISSSEKVYSPSYHPSENKIVASMGTVDIDLALVGMKDLHRKKEFEVGFNQVFQPYPSFERSTRLESQARFNPKTDQIAFVSSRSGSQQVWLAEDGSIRQLSHLKNKENVNGIEWSPNGEMLAYVANDRLIINNLKGASTIFPSAITFKSLLDWPHDKRLYVLATSGSQSQMLEIDYIGEESTIQIEYPLLWAKKYKDGFIFLKEDLGLWIQEKNSIRQLAISPAQITGKPIVLVQDEVFGVGRNDELWRFNLQDNKFEIIEKVHPKVWWIEDIKDDLILLAQAISAKKEIIELSP